MLRSRIPNEIIADQDKEIDKLKAEGIDSKRQLLTLKDAHTENMKHLVQRTQERDEWKQRAAAEQRSGWALDQDLKYWREKAESALLQVGGMKAYVLRQACLCTPARTGIDPLALCDRCNLLKGGSTESRIRADTLGRPIDRAGQVKCEACDVLINYEYPNGEPRRKCSSCT